MQLLRIDWNVVFTIINLIVLYLALRKFLIKPVTNIMEQRKQMIALGGELYRNVDAEFLKNKLTYIQRRERELSKIALWKRRLKDAKTARKNDNK